MHYRQIARLFPKLDYAILGIGAYLPVWFMHPMHQSPKDALQAFSDLKARQMIPMHYGTFDLSDEPMQQPLQDLQNAAKDSGLVRSIRVLPIGEPYPLVFS